MPPVAGDTLGVGGNQHGVWGVIPEALAVGVMPRAKVEHTATGTPTRVRATAWGRSVGLRTLTSVFYSSYMSSQRERGG